MIESIPKSLRVMLALVLLAVVVLWASSVVGRYRTATEAEAAKKPATAAPSTQAQPTQKASTPPAASEGEGEAGETEAKPAEGPVVVVKVDGLNFRQEPDKNSKVIRGLDAGERLKLIERKDGWFNAEDDSGEKGWLYGSSQYSTVEE